MIVKIKCYDKQFMNMKLIQLAMIENFLLIWCYHLNKGLVIKISCKLCNWYYALTSTQLLISQQNAYCGNFSYICVRHVCKHISLLYIIINTTISAPAYFFEFRNTMRFSFILEWRDFYRLLRSLDFQCRPKDWVHKICW